jgi:hypothetical protein
LFSLWPAFWSSFRRGVSFSRGDFDVSRFEAPTVRCSLVVGPPSPSIPFASGFIKMIKLLTFAQITIYYKAGAKSHVSTNRRPYSAAASILPPTTEQFGTVLRIFADCTGQDWTQFDAPLQLSTLKKIFAPPPSDCPLCEQNGTVRNRTEHFSRFSTRPLDTIGHLATLSTMKRPSPSRRNASTRPHVVIRCARTMELAPGSLTNKKDAYLRRRRSGS